MLTRRRVMTASAAFTAAGLGAPGRGRAETFTFKYGSTLPGSHPANIRAQEAAERLRQETNGQLDIKVFADSALGGDSEMLSQVRYGALECMTIAGLITSTVVPTAAINGMGFAFSDYDAVWKAMDGDVGALIRAALGKARLVVMEKAWDNGFRQITTGSTKIDGPHDLNGMKLRVPVSPLYTSMFQKLGAGPTGLSLGETYSALQTHLVEGQENPLIVAETAKFYEVQKFCAMTNHVWDGLWFLVSPRAWNRLPPALQQKMAQVLNDTAVLQRQDIAQLGDKVRTQLQGHGMTFTTPDPAPFRQMLRQSGFYSEWKSKFDAEVWSALEKYVGTLA